MYGIDPLLSPNHTRFFATFASHLTALLQYCLKFGAMMANRVVHGFMRGQRSYLIRETCDEKDVESNYFFNRWEGIYSKMIPKIFFVRPREIDPNSNDGTIEVSWIVKEHQGFGPVTKESLGQGNRLDLLFDVLNHLGIHLLSLRPEHVHIRTDIANWPLTNYPLGAGLNDPMGAENAFVDYNAYIKLLAGWHRTSQPMKSNWTNAKEPPRSQDPQSRTITADTIEASLSAALSRALTFQDPPEPTQLMSVKEAFYQSLPDHLPPPLAPSTRQADGNWYCQEIRRDMEGKCNAAFRFAESLEAHLELIHRVPVERIKREVSDGEEMGENDDDESIE